MASIPTETIEQVAAANDIVEVIGSYFPLKRAGSTFKALCPFHQEKSPSFTVNPARQIFKCFGCGEGGSVFKFVERYENLSFPEAVKKLAARAGIPVIEERGFSAEEDRQHERRRTLLQLHAEAAAWFHENLLKREWAAPAREYLKKRGIDRQIAGNWQIGFAPDSWDAFLNWALQAGYGRAHILQSGLVKPRDEERPNEGEVYDRFRGRVMFPICNDVGEVVAFSGRVLSSESEMAKYLNSPETPLFRKGHVLFGLHKSKRALIDANSAIVCEGQLDLIALFEAGICNVVAPQGTAFTENHAHVLKRFVREIILCFDADPAGQKAAARSLEALYTAHTALFMSFVRDFSIRIAAMPQGDDPDSLIRREGAAAFRERIAGAPDFFDYWIDKSVREADMSTIPKRLDVARALAPTVSAIHDTMMREQTAQKVASRLGVSKVDFERLLPDRKAAGSDVRDRTVTSTPAAAPRHDMAMLCLLALREAEARRLLLDDDWREVLSQTPDSDLLVRILEADLRPDDPASINAFMATLAPGEEALVSGWLLQKVPPNGAVVARDWWQGLKQSTLRRQLQIAEGRLKIPQLSAGELTTLQKQVVDLKTQLDQLAAFSSARVLDS